MHVRREPRPWDYDRVSRPWFDYPHYRYLPHYAPTYIIPYGAYESYSPSYYGPVVCNRDVVGAVMGGMIGGIIGADRNGGRGAAGGAILGALVGGSIGRMIDMSDQACIGQVLEYVPSNEPVYWEDGGMQYEVTPLRTYEASPGLYCREYQTTIYIDGMAQDAYGTACRMPDGAWQAMN
jgi:surface antigen